MHKQFYIVLLFGALTLVATHKQDFSQVAGVLLSDLYAQADQFQKPGLKHQFLNLVNKFSALCEYSKKEAADPRETIRMLKVLAAQEKALKKQLSRSADRLVQKLHLVLDAQVIQKYSEQKGPFTHDDFLMQTFIHFDIDVRNLRLRLLELGPERDGAINELVDKISQVIDGLENPAITSGQIKNMLEDILLLKKKLQSGLGPELYSRVQRLQVGLDIQALLIKDFDIAAIPVPDQGQWHELFLLIDDICKANNMLRPRLYYGDSHGQHVARMEIPELSRTAVIFIDRELFEDSTKTVEQKLDLLKTIITHELGHLYYQDEDLEKKKFMASMHTKLSKNFWRKYLHNQEYKADTFANFYGFGKAGVEEFQKMHDIFGTSQDPDSYYPTAMNRAKNLLAGMRSPDNAINVPLFWHKNPSSRAFYSLFKHDIPEPVWSQRLYRGPKSIDISAQPIVFRPAARSPIQAAQVAGELDAMNKTALLNLAKKANVVLRGIKK